MLQSYRKSYYFLKSQFDYVGGKWNSLVGDEFPVTPLCTRALNAIQYSCNGIAFLTPFKNAHKSAVISIMFAWEPQAIHFALNTDYTLL